MALHQSTKTQKLQLGEWVKICLKIGALAFGGAGRAQMIRDEVVDKRNWFTPDEFQEITTVSVFLPGSNLVNLGVYIGYKLFGNVGGILAALTMGLPGAMFALVVLWFVPFRDENVQRLFQGFSIGSLVLLGVYVYKLMKGLKKHHTQAAVKNFKLVLRLLLAVFIVVAGFLQVPFFAVLIGGILVGLLLEFLV